MLNSAEHEFCPANKSQITNNCNFVKNIAEHENFSANKYENANYCWHFHIFLLAEKFSCLAELSMKSFITSGPEICFFISPQIHVVSTY